MPALLLMGLLCAGPSRPWLEEARDQIARLEFAQALDGLQVARQAPSLEPQVLREIDELRAYCLVALGRWQDSEALWSAMLKADPMAVPNRNFASPKVLRVYEQAKKALFPSDFVQLQPISVDGERVRVKLLDPWAQTTEVVLLVRGSEPAFRDVRMQVEPPGYLASLPEKGRIEYYVEARNGAVVLARFGTAADPMVRPAAAVSLTPVEKPTSTTVPTAVTSTIDSGKGVRRTVGFIGLGLALASAGVATWLAISGHQLRLAARDESKPPGDFAATAIQAEKDGTLRQSWAIGLFIGAGVSAAGGALALAW